jgi:hypothetical protein
MPIEVMIALHGLKDTPVPTILVLGGISLLVLAFVKAGIEFVIDPSQRRPATIFGIVLLGLGIGLYLIPEQQISPIPTPTIVVATSIAPAAIPTLTQIPMPTFWPLGNQTSTDPQPLCTITASDAFISGRENAKSLQFSVTGQGGYCSWIVPLDGYNATSKKQIAFWVRGEKGGEQYEVGIKVRKTIPGQEPKVLEMASISWTQVFVQLDKFKSQDLSSLENFSLNFKVGSGTIYVDQLIFTP